MLAEGRELVEGREPFGSITNRNHRRFGVLPLQCFTRYGQSIQFNRTAREFDSERKPTLRPFRYPRVKFDIGRIALSTFE
jgi:hypothetical protein